MYKFEKSIYQNSSKSFLINPQKSLFYPQKKTNREKRRERKRGRKGGEEREIKRESSRERKRNLMFEC